MACQFSCTELDDFFTRNRKKNSTGDKTCFKNVVWGKSNRISKGYTYRKSGAQFLWKKHKKICWGRGKKISLEIYAPHISSKLIRTVSSKTWRIWISSYSLSFSYWTCSSYQGISRGLGLASESINIQVGTKF